MSMSGGGSKQSSETRPLTPQEQQAYYDQAMTNIKPYMQGADSYVAPTQKTLTDGDYEALTRAVTAPLDQAKKIDMAASDQAMADRGIYTSLNALRNNNDVSEKYAPAYAQAGGVAVNAKANELTQGNTMAMQNAAAIDAAKWRPADYIANLYGAGKGSSSSSSGGSAQGGFSL